MDLLQWANDGALPFLSLRSLSKSVLEKADAASIRFPMPLLEPTGRSHEPCLLGAIFGDFHHAAAVAVSIPFTEGKMRP